MKYTQQGHNEQGREQSMRDQKTSVQLSLLVYVERDILREQIKWILFQNQ
jgi:hypothetical protein